MTWRNKFFLVFLEKKIELFNLKRRAKLCLEKFKEGRERRSLISKPTANQREARLDKRRQRDAVSLGLPSTATWEEIANKRIDQSLRRSARRLGLSEDATLEEIHEAEMKQMRKEHNRTKIRGYSL